MDLSDFFKEYHRAAIAFSGGVDSAYLLYAALHYGADVTAYYVKSAFQPQFELDDPLLQALYESLCCKQTQRHILQSSVQKQVNDGSIRKSRTFTPQRWTILWTARLQKISLQLSRIKCTMLFTAILLPR